MPLDAESTGQGRNLVLLHSLLADRTAFDRVVPALAKKRRVWRVNLPGYGTSPAAGTTVEDYADLIAQSLDEWGSDTDILGNGFGVFIGVALAARHGRKFGRLIAAPALVRFADPAKQPLRALAERVSREGMSGALDVAIRRMFPEPYIAAHPEVVEERKRALAKADPKCFQTACLALAALDLAPVLKNVSNRTLVLSGSEDATTPPALARELANGISGARFEELKGCGHCPQIENPARFVQAVEQFLNAP